MMGILHQSKGKGNAAARKLGGTTMSASRLAKQPEDSAANEQIHDISRRPQFSGLSGELGVASSLLPIQAKLTIGQPNDKYEQEADRVAAEVVQQINAPASVQSSQGMSVQRTAVSEEEEIQAKLENTSLQRKEAIMGGEASPDLDTAINTARGSGQPLDSGLQQSMGQAIGAEFSGVRVHTDATSDRLNQSIQAKAFTTGQDVFFRQGAYNPSSRGGQELIAHELTHVVQQGKSTLQRTEQLSERGGEERSARLLSPIQEKGVIQRYVAINELFPVIKKMDLDNDQRHRVMYWNVYNKFDAAFQTQNASKIEDAINLWVKISEAVGGGERAPGQVHPTNLMRAAVRSSQSQDPAHVGGWEGVPVSVNSEGYPDWLNYFSEFETKLPKENWGKLRFRKGFNRLTAHGWISENAVLPLDEFKKGVAVHVILAVSEYSSTRVVINPHVTVRAKEVQDKYEQIGMIQDPKIKSTENENLGREGTHSSLSIGIKSVRDKKNTNAAEVVGKEMEELEKEFTEAWLRRIKEDAWEAAKAGQEKGVTEITKAFEIK
jgi:hypothetical protein